MTHIRPHAIVLDAMVCGQPLDAQNGASETHSPESLAWEALVSSPTAAQDWHDAVVRRQRMDQTAMWIQTHPWLARAWLTIRTSRRRGHSAVVPAVVVQLESSANRLTAVLGPDASPALHRLELEWGAVKVFSMNINEVVSLSGQETQSNFAIHYQTATSSGILESGRWRLEPGDAPVLLQVTASTHGENVGSSPSPGRHSAGVLLVENCEQGGGS